ncbi:outer membrane protein [Roseovarius sp. MBR-78]|jgi:outer membrane protein|uniref:OmpW/AlkL family protein n=1 Tax=Roseovarius sp. MBR-78 TaxID=3156460 RepID=UPI0033970EB9
MKHITALTLTALMASTAAPALAQEKGDFLLGLGLGWIEPDDGSNTALPGGKISADGALSPTITLEYFVADRVGIELLASWPFKHDLELGSTQIGETKHLPPTLSLQYHFTNASKITPFVGAGINYTYFFDEELDGPAAPSLDLDDSWGLALHAGVDYAISEKAALRADVRYIDIETDVEVGGVDIGEVKIDPWVFNVAYVMKF